MKPIVFSRIALILFVMFSVISKAQTASPSKKYPASFEISNAQFDKLLTNSQGSKISMRNKYLKGSVVEINSRAGDNKQLKLKLAYFANASLIIQINGKDTKQIFIISTDDSAFYKGIFKEQKIVMTKCEKDDILSE